MTYNEEKDIRTNKAVEHQKNALKGKHAHEKNNWT